MSAVARMMVDQTGPVGKSVEESGTLQEHIYPTTLY
jgi:hypothetical protein